MSPSTSSDHAGLVRVGLALRPHGLGGELLVMPLTDDPARFRRLDAVYVEPGAPAGTPEHAAVERVRFKNGRPIIKLHGCDDAGAALAYKGRYLSITRDQLMPLPEGSYYIFDLVGCDVFAPGGERLGVLEDVIETGGNDVYVVRDGQGELLVPAIRQVVREVDTAARRIVADMGAMATMEYRPGAMEMEMEEEASP